MGTYNPHLPQILGQEWVPIRDVPLILNPFANTVERGYSFNLPTATNVNNVRFYLKDWPETFGSNMVFTAGIYPEGKEANSGPVRSVVIPCSYAEITGTAVAPVFAGLTPAQNLFANGDNYFLYWTMGQANPETWGVSAFFAVSSYAPLLSRKRILGVDLLTGINVLHQGFSIEESFQSIRVDVTTDFGYTPLSYDTMRLPDLVSNQTPASTTATVRMRLGDANRFFGVGSGTTAGVNQIMPWTYPELARFEAAATNRLSIRYGEEGITAALGPQFQLEYCALEVFYCEESRLLTGSRVFNDDIPNRPSRDPFNLGANAIVVRDPVSSNANTSLPAGNYTVTLGESNLGDNYYAAVYRAVAELNEVRQLYTIPSHPGVQINLPFPLNEDTIGEEFEYESTALIPQLTMHVSGGDLIQYSHVYGQQSAGQVFTSNTVTQEIDDRGVTSQQWPWVRYYARRFGKTTAPLTLCGYSPASGLLLPGTSGSYASTPDDAALDIVGDIEMRADVVLANWNTGVQQVFISKSSAPTDRSFFFRIATTGALEFLWSSTGLAFAPAVQSTVNPTPGANNRLSVRMTFDADNGAAGNTTTFYTGPTIDGPWTQLGAPVVVAGVATIFSGTAQVEVGGVTNGTGLLMTGTMLAARIYNSAGTIVANPDFSAQSPGTTSFVDSAGRTWTIFGSAAIVEGIISATSALCVKITPTDFDALNEIVDGWKEVTLRFPTAPTMGGGTIPSWRWSATSETVGSRWEVLGATAPAVSAIVQDTNTNFWLPFAQVPTAQRLHLGTYGYAVSGGVINESWLPQWGPYVSGTTDDQASDVCVIFAQDMALVTGFGVVTASQAITGIGQNCGIDPCGIPTAILYNQLSWGPFGNGTYVRDIFDRAAIGWNSTNTGQPWVDVGGTVEGNYVTTGTAGTHILDGAANVLRTSSLNVFANNSHHRVKYSINVVTAGASARAGIMFNRVDANNYDFVDFRFATFTQTIEVVISRFVAGVSTGATNITAGAYGADQEWWADVDVATDGTIRAKTWPVGGPEPVSYQATLAATFTGGGVGLRSIRSTGNTNTDAVISYSDYTVGPSTWNFGYLEVQRSDEITEWATIMKSTSPAITGFKDFEARTGMLSNYRIRGVDVYDFPGPWSSTASIAITSPGVSGSCLDAAHIMIFTTNEHQSGYSNLAYSNAWEGQVSEDFAFAEAGFTQLQPMYDRDFFTAFRPTERGGDQFGRSVLVQAAAIDPATLPGFRALSDMAWTDVSYICVRDEDGNRWFASINVPAGVVQNRRQLYLATVQVVEVTSTPSPVDPS